MEYEFTLICDMDLAHGWSCRSRGAPNWRIRCTSRVALTKPRRRSSPGLRRRTASPTRRRRRWSPMNDIEDRDGPQAGLHREFSSSSGPPTQLAESRMAAAVEFVKGPHDRPWRPVRLLGQNVDYTHGHVDSHLGNGGCSSTARSRAPGRAVRAAELPAGKLLRSARPLMGPRPSPHAPPDHRRCGGVCERCSDARLTEVHLQAETTAPLANVPSHLITFVTPCNDHIHANP